MFSEESLKMWESRFSKKLISLNLYSRAALKLVLLFSFAWDFYINKQIKKLDNSELLQDNVELFHITSRTSSMS